MSKIVSLSQCDSIKIIAREQKVMTTLIWDYEHNYKDIIFCTQNHIKWNPKTILYYVQRQPNPAINIPW